MAGRQALSRPSAAEGGGRRPALTGLAVRPNSATKVDAQTPHGRTPPPLCGESLQPGASPRSGRLTAERPVAQARASTSCRPRPPQGPLACSRLARANKYFSLTIGWRRYKQHVPQSRPAANGFDGPYGLQGGSILMSRGGSILESAKVQPTGRLPTLPGRQQCSTFLEVCTCGFIDETANCEPPYHSKGSSSDGRVREPEPPQVGSAGIFVSTVGRDEAVIRNTSGAGSRRTVVWRR
jgi:hypothetical protein